MKTNEATRIKEYNPTALKEIGKHLEFSNWEAQRVIKTITFSDFESVGVDLRTILSAIETIGFNSQDSDSGLCAGLASIAQKLIPDNELRFLDHLLIKEDSNKNNFTKIETTSNE